jgi:thiol-disulfide isomerase/thioredoxin
VRNLENRERRDCLRNSLRYARAMKSAIFLLAMLTFGLAGRAAEALPIEQQVAEVVKSPKVTVIHFWATWCPNCRGELMTGGWKDFITRNPNVNVIFVTVRDEKSGGAELKRYGIGEQKNFTHLQHPNASRNPDTEVTSFMGLRVGWVPATWIYRDGKLRYALNYGQIRFPILQQLVEDALPKWD